MIFVKESRRLTISTDDVLKAAEDVEFQEFVKPLKASLAGGSSPLLGDTLVIVGILFFAMSNVGEEFCVKKKDRVEVDCLDCWSVGFSYLYWRSRVWNLSHDSHGQQISGKKKVKNWI